MIFRVLLLSCCFSVCAAFQVAAQGSGAVQIPLMEASLMSTDVETISEIEGESSVSMDEALSAPAISASVVPRINPANSFNDATRTGGLLEAHNAARVAEGLEPLKWSYKLEAYANEWATELALTKNCRTYHRPYSGRFGQQYGENLFEASPIRSNRAPDKLKEISAQWVVDVWMSEKPFYDFYTGDCEAGKVCGHYTQIMWEDTTEVGCARVQCPSLKQAWVCNYAPRGNLPGELAY